MKYKDYYKILGVDKNADQQQIKKSFRRLAKKYHPDAHPGDKVAEEKFKEINEAYEVLGDEQKRKKYDQLGEGFNFQNGYDFDPSQFGFGNNIRYEHRTAPNNDFSDFFNMIFGEGTFDINSLFSRGGRAGRSDGFTRQYAVDGENMEADIEITPEEGFYGKEKKVTLMSNGRERIISFKIPEGIMEGGKIKISNQGYPGMNGGRNGDLYLRVRFKSSSRFKVEGKNLLTSLNLTPWEAALGTEIPFNTLDGKIIVKIPAGIQTGNRIRVAGKGYKDKYGGRGDLFLKVSIVNPGILSNEERKLYEKLSQVSEFRPER
ncbi:MAG: DnaJ C-terminal domain-containing protein [Acetivibrionales bacterium]|jgi:curved DNA-binding protein